MSVNARRKILQFVKTGRFFVLMKNSTVFNIKKLKVLKTCPHTCQQQYIDKKEIFSKSDAIYCIITKCKP